MLSLSKLIFGLALAAVIRAQANAIISFKAVDNSATINVRDSDGLQGVKVKARLLLTQLNGTLVANLVPGVYATASTCSLEFTSPQQEIEFTIFPGVGVTPTDTNSDFDHTIQVHIQAPGIINKRNDFIVRRYYKAPVLCMMAMGNYLKNFDKQVLTDSKLGWNTLLVNDYTTVQALSEECGSLRCTTQLAVRHGPQIMLMKIVDNGIRPQVQFNDRNLGFIWFESAKMVDSANVITFYLKDGTFLSLTIHSQLNYKDIITNVRLPGYYQTQSLGICGNSNGAQDDNTNYPQCTGTQCCATFECSRDTYFNHFQKCEPIKPLNNTNVLTLDIVNRETNTTGSNGSGSGNGSGQGTGNGNGQGTGNGNGQGTGTGNGNGQSNNSTGTGNGQNNNGNGYGNDNTSSSGNGCQSNSTEQSTGYTGTQSQNGYGQVQSQNGYGQVQSQNGYGQVQSQNGYGQVQNQNGYGHGSVNSQSQNYEQPLQSPTTGQNSECKNFGIWTETGCYCQPGYSGEKCELDSSSSSNLELDNLGNDQSSATTPVISIMMIAVVNFFAL